MNRRFERLLPYYLLLAFFINLVIFVLLSDGTVGGADDINHYKFSRYGFENPAFFLNTWAKTLFTVLFAPVAQLGFNAVRIFNILLGLATALLTYQTARKLNYKFPLLALFLLVFAPMYFMLMLSGMTEILFSFLLILAIYLYFDKKTIWSSVIVSVLPFVRTEGVVLFPLFLLAFVWYRNWKAVPFLLTGFILFSIIGSFYYQDLLWVINEMPYKGDASDIYGSGELLYYVYHQAGIFGFPFSALILAGLLYTPVHFFRSKKEARSGFAAQVLVGFLPFIAYFCAHSYVFWKGQGNSVGEIRVIAAVFPSAVLLAVFGWNELLRGIRLHEFSQKILTLALCVLLIFIPFTVHRIPVPLAPSQKLIKEAVSWLGDSDYAARKVYIWDPFWWFFLDVDPTDETLIREGVYDKNNPGESILPGEIILWDAHFGPNEGRMPLERLADNPDFMEVKVFRPDVPFTVLGGYDYEIHMFERVESGYKSEQRAVLEEILNREDSAYQARLLAYHDYELQDSGQVSRYIKSGSNSLQLVKDREFLPGFEVPIQGINPAKGSKIHVRISHYFEESGDQDPLLFVVTLQNSQKMIFYRSWEIKPKKLHTWEETSFEHPIPEWESKGDILKVYLWNRGKNAVWLDDFIIAVKDP